MAAPLAISPVQAVLRAVSDRCPGKVIFRQLEDSVSNTYTYVLACPATFEAIIIDSVMEKAPRDVQVVHDLGGCDVAHRHILPFRSVESDSRLTLHLKFAQASKSSPLLIRMCTQITLPVMPLSRNSSLDFVLVFLQYLVQWLTSNFRMAISFHSAHDTFVCWRHQVIRMAVFPSFWTITVWFFLAMLCSFADAGAPTFNRSGDSQPGSVLLAVYLFSYAVFCALPYL